MMFRTSFVSSLLSGVVVAFPMTPVFAQSSTTQVRGTIEEVVVTARKVEESIQDSPVAITALSGDQLETRAALNISDATASAPNVSFESSGATSGMTAAPIVFIRGLGQADFVINADPAVGTYLDGIYLGRSLGSLADLLDLQRVEVLRGPQGTLFGRNTIGGAINLISVAPSMDGNNGEVNLATGENGYSNLKGYANFALSDSSALRVSAFARQRDGFVDALQYDDFDLGEEDVWGIRAALRIDVTNEFTIDFTTDYSERSDSPSPMVARLIGNASIGGELIDQSGTPAGTRFNTGGPPPTPPVPSTYRSVDPATCRTAAGRNSSTDCYGNIWLGDGYQSNALYTDVNGNIIEPDQNLDVFGANLTMTWETSFGTLKSITSARGFDSSFHNDIDYSPFVIMHNINSRFDQDQFSQEFQLAGSSARGNIDYVIGLYYFEEDGIETVALVNPLLPPAAAQTTLPLYQVTDRYIDNTSTALYGQITWHASENLHITAGLRYTDETKDIAFEQRRSVGATLANAEGNLSLKETAPMANVSYNFSDNLMGYFTYAQGFRSGGFASRFPSGLVSPLPSYDPEFVDSYEFGFKSDLLENRVRLNVAAFMTNYQDLQVSATSPVISGGSLTANLADATLQGLEIELNAAVTDNFYLDMSLGYLDAEIDSVVGDVLNAGAGNQRYTITEDSDLPNTPEKNFSVGFTHYLPVASGELRTRVDWRYVDDQHLTIENHPLALEDSYTTLNANISYAPLDSNWRITIGGRNLTDEEYATATALNTTAATLGTNVSRPREVYVQATYRIGE